MTAGDFETLMGRLSLLIAESVECARFARRFPESSRLGEEEAWMIQKARKIQSAQDKVMKNELHHILGMGDLNEGQTLIFAEAIKKLGETRDEVKRLASAKDGWVPKMEPEAEFTASVLLPNSILMHKREENPLTCAENSLK